MVWRTLEVYKVLNLDMGRKKKDQTNPKERYSVAYFR